MAMTVEKSLLNNQSILQDCALVEELDAQSAEIISGGYGRYPRWGGGGGRYPWWGGGGGRYPWWGRGGGRYPWWRGGDRNDDRD